jgi:hypothetical protein
MLFNLISFFGGFFTSSLIDTSLGEFSEWAVVGSSLLVATIESFNSLYYASYQTLKPTTSVGLVFNFLNFFKIGIIYGLIVDAFKLGS